MECVHSYIPGTQGVNTSLPGLKAHSTWTPSVDELRLEMRLTTLSLVKKKKKNSSAALKMQNKLLRH